MFPCWMYHRTKPAKIVENEMDASALGPEWAPSPADFLASDMAAVPAAVEVVAKDVHDEVVAKLEAVKTDYAEFFEKIKSSKTIAEIKKLLEDYDGEEG